jgi:hypothetical protein
VRTNSRDDHSVWEEDTRVRYAMMADERAVAQVPGIVAHVRIPPGRKVKSARLLRQDWRATFRLQDGCVSIELPPTELYEGIHIELG